ncbi:MAG: hypothetical protein ACRDZX_04285, partial [Acidimicrobiales bacterium]
TLTCALRDVKMSGMREPYKKASIRLVGTLSELTKGSTHHPFSDGMYDTVHGEIETTSTP